MAEEAEIGEIETHGATFLRIWRNQALDICHCASKI
jgi:hypothetical protein